MSREGAIRGEVSDVAKAPFENEGEAGCELSPVEDIDFQQTKLRNQVSFGHLAFGALIIGDGLLVVFYQIRKMPENCGSRVDALRGLGKKKKMGEEAENHVIVPKEKIKGPAAPSKHILINNVLEDGKCIDLLRALLYPAFSERVLPESIFKSFFLVLCPKGGSGD